MKKVVTSLVAAVILLSCLTPYSFAAYDDKFLGSNIIEPRYDVISNISATLVISDSGRADCGASVIVPSGYTVDLTAELQQKVGNKWNTIHDWDSSGEHYISTSGRWYVLSGYSYRLKVTATTYDSRGNFIEAPVEYSPTRDY